MNKCAISGLPTNNLWKGKPILKAFVKAAQSSIRNRTVREHLVAMQIELRSIVKKEKPESAEAYGELIKKFIKDYR